MAPRLPLPRPGHVVKRFVPRSLLGRSLLIILLPLVVVQAVALQIFYGSHLDLVSRRLSFAVAGEIAAELDMLRRFHTEADDAFIRHQAWHDYELTIRIRPGAQLEPQKTVNLLGPMDDDFTAALAQKLHVPFTTDWVSDPQSVLVGIQLQDGVMEVVAPRKRLYTGTIWIFLAWLVGSSLLLFGIAALFMRNQVRAIRRLAAAAEAFGMGRDQGPIRPEGAIEVRRAAAAFNRMRDRLRRFVGQRTELLAGVSHDLRTPLTRLRLALAMLPQDEALRQDVAEMTADVEEMERMIRAYLAFARGESTEEAQQVNLSALLEEVAAGARRAGAVVELNAPPAMEMRLRPDAVRRAIANLVDNAGRHAQRVALAALPQGRSVDVTVDDDGPGIPPERRESVFRSFAAGAGGGTGLGLTIARDIVRAHGGEITLEDSPLGGLRARIRLPV